MAVSKFELTAEIRNEQGKGASRRQRRLAKQVPAIMYGGGEAPQMLLIDHNQFYLALRNEAFYSHILTIDIGGKKQRAVMRDLQRHPYKQQLLHADFLRVTGKEKIQMRVPLRFTGGDVCPGVKEGGLVSHLINEVDVRCLPDDLPEYLSLDISQMNVNDSLHLSNLTLPKGVELATPIRKKEQDLMIVSVHIPRVVEEEIPTTAPEAPVAEVPTIEKGKEAKEGKEAEKDEE